MSAAMKPTITVNFSWFWAGFTFDTFLTMFPSISKHYDLQVTDNPEVLFYSVFGDQYWETMPPAPSGDFVRVFITGENVEPAMEQCDFAISFSALVDSPRHLRLPLWVYESRCWGLTPEALVKRPDTDWEKVA